VQHVTHTLTENHKAMCVHMSVYNLQGLVSKKKDMMHNKFKKCHNQGLRGSVDNTNVQE